ncbi:putative LPS assembly protein LptD [Limibacter armeniacum]|uniref:putative LPS assembly protein LptD n=1 Tax=Limibacter armeniacum TaxID=466084 RepID=UPI002FE63225
MKFPALELIPVWLKCLLTLFFIAVISLCSTEEVFATPFEIEDGRKALVAYAPNKVEGDTSEIRKAVRALAQTIQEKNQGVENEVLTKLTNALFIFANEPVFRGDRYKQEIMDELATEEKIAAFRKLNQTLQEQDENTWEELLGSDIIADIFNIGYEFDPNFDVEEDTLNETLDNLVRKGASAIAKPKSMLDTDLRYGANGPNAKTRVDARTQVLYIEDEAFVDYGERSLKAGKIELSFVSNTVRAYGLKNDSTGKVEQKPIFSEAGQTFNANEMLYNFDTQKGVIKGIVTEEGDGIIQSHIVKKTPAAAVYMEDNIYTTCNLEHPHYGIRAKKLKIVPKKNIVTGPFLFELNGLPLPLGLPFGLFPATQKRASGVVMPSYGEGSTRGFYLQDGGFYLALNDYLGLRATASIYSLGGWDASIQTTYRKRYAFSGSFSFNYANNTFLLDDGTRENNVKDYRLQWSHSQDSKGSSRFTASVNIASQTYNQNNVTNVYQGLQASTNSSVRYSNSLNLGGVTLSGNASLRHNQNITTGAARLNPDVSLTMSRVRPFDNLFKKKNPLSQLSIQYTGQFTGEVNNEEKDPGDDFNFDIVTPEEEVVVPPTVGDEDETLPDLFANFGDYIGDFEYGITHTIPIQTTVTLLKHFTITPSANYREYWVPNKFNYTWNDEQNAVEVDTLSKFARYYQFSTSAGLSTNMYMFYDFKGGSRLRQAIRPTISYTFTPDFSTPNFNFYQEVQTDADGTSDLVLRSGSSYVGQPSSSRSSVLSFGVTNQFELKLGKKDEDGKAKKITLLDNLSISSSYDFERDSLNLSNFRVNARTRLFQKVDINVNGTFDPYKYVATGYKFDEELEKVVVSSQIKTNDFLWSTDGKLAQLTNLNVSIGTRLAPSKAKKKSEDKLANTAPRNETEAAILEDMRRNPQDYIDFNVPWSLSVNYNLNWNKTGLAESNVTQAVTLRGDLSLTPKWKLGYNTGYDIEERAFTRTSLDLSRDLHCWQMTLNWVPFGRLQSYSININVKSSMLQDLKWQRRQTWQDNPNSLIR